MNGMLLAAGRGERMEPLSSWLPKPALEVLGEPLLASSLRHLVAAGCRRVVINLHRHPERVAAAARDAATGGPTPLFSWEPRLLGGAGGVAAAQTLLGGGSVLAANADVWAELDLAGLLAVEDEDAIVLALLPHPDPGRWNSVVLDGHGRITALLPPGARPPGERFLFTGFQLLGERVVTALPEPPAEMATVWDGLRRQGRLRGVVVSGSWREAGTPAAYRELVVTALHGENRIACGAEVADDAVCEVSAVGTGCRVGARADLRESIVTSGAHVGPGCHLVRCVVAGPVPLAGPATLHDVVVLPDGVHPLLR